MNNDNKEISEADGRQRPSFWRRPKFLIPCATLIAILLVVGVCAWSEAVYQADQKLDAESVTLKGERTMAFGEVRKVSDFLENLNGTLVEDLEIQPDELGDVDVAFDYINIKNKRRTIHFKVKVIDTTAPKIYGSSAYTVPVGYAGDLTDLMLSGDDLDDNPERRIAGEYDINKVGRYNLEYVIADASGNETKQKFTLNVVKPSNNEAPTYEAEKLPISEVIKKYKTDDTKIGIDISQWQGEISWDDWSRVKDAGVEFVFVRVGYQTEFGGEYILDPYFQENMLNASEQGLMTGVYFYSYADSVEEAREQARWVKSKISGFGVPLGVAFDWESWSEFNHAGMSFRTINNVAKAFLDEINEGDHTRSEYSEEKPGFTGLLYGSKNYLEKIWDVPGYDIWLAQYYDRVTYDGEYKYWQMSNSGRVDGIYGDVDVNIMYLNGGNNADGD